MRVGQEVQALSRSDHLIGSATWALVATLSLSALWASAASAQAVTLRDGDRIVAEGELLGFDGRFYRVATTAGELTLDGRELSCGGEACPAAASPLRISGEGYVVSGVLPALIETFARRRGYDMEVEQGDTVSRYALTRDGSQGIVELYPTTSGEGIADLIGDASDIAVSLRPPLNGEDELLRAAGRGTLTAPGRSAILALDALVPVVSLTEPVETLPFDTFRAILQGRITDWSGAGASGGPVSLHLPREGSGAADALSVQVPGSSRAEAQRHPDLSTLSTTVERTPGAIGVTLLSALGGAEAVGLTGPCGARALATEAAIKTEDYPLTVPVFLFAPERRLSAFARDLVDFVTSPAAQPVIRRAGLVDQFPEAIPFAAQGDRLALSILSAGDDVNLPTLRAMIRDLVDLTRLSISFRFEDGAAVLDAQSQSNVTLLGEALERGLFDGRRLLLAGFSDGAGDGASNRRLSRARAVAVRDAVAAAAPSADVTLDVAAYGEALPMACDTTAWGRRMNRRVEVWLD